MKFKGVLVGLIVASSALYVAAGPYITAFEMQAAAESNDGEKLSEYVDFVLLRQNLKDQLNTSLLKEMNNQAEENPMAELGAALGGFFVDGIVDAYVTPSGLTQMMNGEKPDESALPGSGDESSANQEAFKDAVMSYESFSKFSIVVSSENGEDTATFILRRTGLEWKLTEIILPI